MSLCRRLTAFSNHLVRGARKALSFLPHPPDRIRKMIDPAVLERMRRDWDARARENARHYVATGRREWSDEDFFRSGAAEVRNLVGELRGEICNGRDQQAMKVLEIGCGAGRMTLPLSRIFGRVDAVDVSGQMIANAKAALREHTNVGLHLNNGADLSMF